MRIAVTGGIAEGKSTILAHLESIGASTISADDIARTLLADNEIQRDISSLARVEETLEPAKIRLLLSLDDGFRRSLNKLLHPLVLAEIENSTAMFVEVPLLLETCMHASFDAIWVAYAGRESQLMRLNQRYPDKDAESILSTQTTGWVRKVFADAVIPTNGRLEDTILAIEKEVKRWALPLVVS